MLIKEVMYGLNDVSIIPASVSKVSSRKEVNPYIVDENLKNLLGVTNNMLPLFTAPMFNVVGSDSYKDYENNSIIPIIPRTENLESRIEFSKTNWVAFGLNEFKNVFLKPELNSERNYVLIDIANGNMKILMDYITEAKKIHGNKIVIMAGNVANPLTYIELSNAGADFVRVGIGGGLGCTTTSNVGIHYSLASLIDECRTIRKSYLKPARIIADGGIRGYSDIIKCLALGADFVMCGSLFNKMYESSGNQYRNDQNIFKLWKYDGHELYSDYFGMSTKKAQQLMGNTNLKTGEGRFTTQRIEYTMSGWVENFTDYLKSAMSYCGVTELKYFNPYNVNLKLLSSNAYSAINK